MNWLVAYATSGLGMEQAKASNYLAVFFGGVMLGRLVLSPLVDRLGILKSMGVFGSLSAVLYIAGVVGGAAAMPLWAASGFFLSILYPTLVMSIRLFFPHGQVAGAAGTIISVASLFDILFNCRLRPPCGYAGLRRQHLCAAAGHGGVHHHLPGLFTRAWERNSRRTDGSALCGYAGALQPKEEIS